MWQQANVAVLEYRRVREQVAVGEFGIGDAHFHGATGCGVAAFRFAFIVTPNTTTIADAVARAAVTPVKFECAHVVQIQAEPDQALGVPGTEFGQQTLRPLLAITLPFACGVKITAASVIGIPVKVSQAR